MCGSGKKRVQSNAELQAGQSKALEDKRAQEMQDRLQNRRNEINIPAQRETANVAAVGQLESGGYDLPRIDKIRSDVETAGGEARQRYEEGRTRLEEGRVGLEEGKAPARRLASDVGYSGAGREGYADLATTGGFNPGEREQFLRRATAPTAAIYARSNDELDRRKAVQGGYMPGFTSSHAKSIRGAAQAGAEASLSGNVELARQVREGKVAGLGGLERTRKAAGDEQLQAGRDITSATSEQVKAASEQIKATTAQNQQALDQARALGTFEKDIATGRQNALNVVTRLLGMSIDEMANLDTAEIQNRATQAGMTAQEINALLGIAAQTKSPLEKGQAIGEIAKDVGQGVGGAAGAVGGK